MLGTIKPTRGELMRTRKRITLAKRGHELLKKKQDSLVIEFFKLLNEIKRQHFDLMSEYVSAVKKLNEARAMESDLVMKACALDVQEVAPMRLSIKNIAGVRIPQISRVAAQRARPVYETPILLDIGMAYSAVVERALDLAAKETALRKVLVEIKKTKRRAHALEEIFIPELERVKAHITFELEERAREEFTRLKKRKTMM